MTAKRIYIALIALLVLCGALAVRHLVVGTKGGGSNSAPDSVTLVQEWIPNSNYAGAVMAQKRFAPIYRLDLKIIQGADNINAVQMVSDGQATFGDASADAVLVANQKGADLVVIGVVSPINPTVFVSKVEKDIKTPKEWEGHRIGILDGTDTEYVYRAMVHANRLNPAELREVSADFDLKSFVATDKIDVRPAYVYDEPIELDELHVKYDVVDPQEWNVKMIGTVYFTRRDTILHHRPLVQKFVHAIEDGWRAAVEHQDDAVADLVEYDKLLNPKRMSRSLKKALPYIAVREPHGALPDRLLWTEPKEWKDTVSLLQSLGAVPDDFDVSKTLDMSFLEQVYETDQHN